jgi:hypothetical protein
LHILQRHERHAIAFARGLQARLEDHAAETDFFAVLEFPEALGIGEGVQAELAFVARQRMPRDVEADDLLLVGQQLTLLPFRQRRDTGAVDGPNCLLEIVEHADLAIFTVALAFLPGFEIIVQAGHHLRPRLAGGIKRPAFDQTLNDAAIDDFQIYALAKIEQRAEPSPLFSCRDDGFDGIIADILHGGQTETNRLPDHAEVTVTIVDIWRQEVDGHVT